MRVGIATAPNRGSGEDAATDATSSLIAGAEAMGRPGRLVVDVPVNAGQGHRRVAEFT